MNRPDSELALETIAGFPQKAQAVVLASLESQNVKFINLFRRDNRTDPACSFIFFSGTQIGLDLKCVRKLSTEKIYKLA